MKKRIEELLKIKQLRKADLARKLNVSYGTLYSHFNDTDLARYIYDIANIFPDISKDWLFFGRGEIFEDEKNNKFIAQELNLVKEQLENEKKQLELFLSEIEILQKKVVELEKRLLR